MREFHAAPEGRNIFQKNAFARFGGFGQQQAGGHLPQLCPAGVQCGNQHDPDGGPGREEAVLGVERGEGLRYVVHDVIRIDNDGGEKLHADKHAGKTAQQAGKQCIKDVFCRNLPRRITQCLEGADLQTLFFDHTGHGGEGHQCRDEE
ncbi:hypothetical protein SDC9_144699 [bioreactor metagenome]|uniref:Uncharacterized protein n=1 Tax=bioreactor metagenome TaxID=1076179 RepID=A0A645E7R3_9ZZZZ